MTLRFLAPLLCLVLLAGCESAPLRLQPIKNPAPAYDANTFAAADVEQPPVPRYRQPPVYPFEMRRAGITGAAMIDFVVDVDGSVINATALEANDVRFADAARNAVAKWKFRPGESNGHPVRTHLQVPIQFTLDGAGPTEPPREMRQLSADAELYDLAQVDRQPMPQYRQPPVYPFAMRKAGIGGEAMIDFVVTTDGTTANVHAVRASAQLFADAAVACISHWRFRPGIKDGAPVNCHMQVPIVFTLNDE